MVTVDEVQRLLLAGGDVIDPDGRKIGSVGQLFLDADSGEPAWVTVTTGLFGRGESFVPLAGAVAGERDLQVRYDKDQVKHAPRIESSDGTLSPHEERELFRHYGLGGHGDDDDRRDPGEDDRIAPREDLGHEHHAGLAHDDVRHDDVRHDDVRDDDVRHEAVQDEDLPDEARHENVRHEDAGTGATAVGGMSAADPTPEGTAADGMVLRAERAKVVGTERVPTERVRLRRYTVTENRTISVPVSREEYRIEYDSAEGEPPLAGGDQRTAPAPEGHDDGHDGHDGPRHRR